ncbi:TerC/Alx family metal homeostasis membrane protein [Gryllotalpicola ginsengisoli]|uniref:TerC/Alx family metal homeostasis membrane protein n=1 Tax=Gryllotalpicola ginsengisoli TaxID=444608 RepID=UPI0003B75139|nr:TerC/Alx family metal homeostasis membrane protein [Gryllotalpicola ginsengisoli]
MHLDFPLWFELTSYAVLVLILAADLTLAYLRPHVPSAKESGLWVGFYVGLALLFALALWAVGGPEHAGQFIAGWLTEYSLSVDNLFVFVLIMARFAVPPKYQQEALMVGIIVALVFRGVFIVLGASLIANFSWIFYLFGAFLLYTAIRQATESEQKEAEQEESKDSALVAWLRHHLRIGGVYDGNRLHTVVADRRVFTPMVLVFISLGTTDLLFALDSIPAIFGITTSPFLVFSANVFALMGLRQLFFLLGHLLEKLEYLKYGIAVILAFIGVKLVLHAMHENEVPFINGGHGIHWAPEISTWTSLGVIIVTMAAATVASLARLRARERG